MPGTTPVYGFPYPEPTDLVADYPALGQQLAEDIEAVLPDVGGLVAVAPTSIANSGGSASTTGHTTTFTGVSSISLNGVFSADYNNYRLVAFMSQSSAGHVDMRLRASGTDLTSGYIWQSLYAEGTVISAFSYTAQTVLQMVYIPAGGYGSVISDLMNPYAVQRTQTLSVTGSNQSNGLVYNRWGFVNDTTQRDGVSLIAGAGTLTGTVSVYGYKK